MILMSISWGSLCSNAALVDDGELAHSVSEERFSGIKNAMYVSINSKLDALELNNYLMIKKV